MKKTEQENEGLKEKLKALEESSVSENGLKFGYSFNLHCPLRSSPKNSWTPLIRIRLFRIPRYFVTQNHFSWLCPAVIYYRLCRTPSVSDYFRFPSQLQIAGFDCISVEIKLNTFIC